MAVLTKVLGKKSLSEPDEVLTFPKTRVELFHFGEQTISRFVLDPGWKWEEHIKPTAGTDYCTAPHYGYLVSGKMGLRMSDGTQVEFHAGDLMSIPPDHSAWVIGNEAAVMLDFGGGGEVYRDIS